MVDRLEELLALLEEEDENEDERVDALEAAVPAAPAAEAEPGTASERGGDEKALPKVGRMDWRPDGERFVPERREEVPGADGGMAEEAGAGEKAELWLDGLAEAVMGPHGAAVLRRPGAGDVEWMELSGQPGWSGTAEGDAVINSLTSVERGLEGLYRQASQASRPAAQAAPVEQAGRALRAEEPGRTAALTVDELDRAVRRDSRRYDGGMAIF